MEPWSRSPLLRDNHSFPTGYALMCPEFGGDRLRADLWAPRTRSKPPTWNVVGASWPTQVDRTTRSRGRKTSVY